MSNKSQQNLVAAKSNNHPLTGQHIPAALRSIANWLVWAYVVVAGAARKLPYRENGSPKDWNNPSHWMGYDTALGVQNNQFQKYCGLAFVLDKDCGIVCLDFDDCVVDGEVHQLADEIISCFPGAYVEWSPSKTGFKLYIRGALPQGASRAVITAGEGDDSFQIELFACNKWVAVTGEPYGEPGDVIEAQAALDQLLIDYPPKLTTSTASRLSAPEDVEAWVESDDASLRAKNAFAWLRDDAEESVNGAGGNSVMYSVMTGLWNRGIVGHELWNLLSWYNVNKTSAVNDGPAEWSSDELERMLLSVQNTQGHTGFGLYLPAAEDFEPILVAGFLDPPKHVPTGRLRHRNAADVQTRRVKWLWQDYFPRGCIVLVDGAPGSGKSSLVMAFIALWSTGRPMPFSDPLVPPAAPLNCAVLNYEDPPDTVIGPRLVGAEADLKKVLLLDGVLQDGSQLHLPDCIGDLDEVVAENDIKVLVIDPFDSMFPSGLSPNSGPDVRKVLQPVKDMAEQRDMTVFIIRHLNKKTGEEAMHRGAGSMGIVGIARAAFNVGFDPRNKENEFTRVICPQKCNLGPMPPGIEFTTESVTIDLDDGTSQAVTGINWHGLTDLTANELTGAVKAPKDSKTKLQQAAAIIRDALFSKPMPEQEIWKMVSEAGIGKSTYNAARKQEGVISKPSGFQGSHMLYLKDWHTEADEPSPEGLLPVVVADEGVGATTLAAPSL